MTHSWTKSLLSLGWGRHWAGPEGSQEKGRFSDFAWLTAWRDEQRLKQPPHKVRFDPRWPRSGAWARVPNSHWGGWGARGFHVLWRSVSPSDPTSWAPLGKSLIESLPSRLRRRGDKLWLLLVTCSKCALPSHLSARAFSRKALSGDIGWMASLYQEKGKYLFKGDFFFFFCLFSQHLASFGSYLLSSCKDFIKGEKKAPSRSHGRSEGLGIGSPRFAW